MRIIKYLNRNEIKPISTNLRTATLLYRQSWFSPNSLLNLYSPKIRPIGFKIKTLAFTQIWTLCVVYIVLFSCCCCYCCCFFILRPAREYCTPVWLWSGSYLYKAASAGICSLRVIQSIDLVASNEKHAVQLI